MMTKAEFEEIDKKVAKMLKEGRETQRLLKMMMASAKEQDNDG
jgi:DNA-binding transcriptional regulator/RsmH inhibitor MraZ